MDESMLLYDYRGIEPKPKVILDDLEGNFETIQRRGTVQGE
jgi:hypothetical protein